MNPSLARETFPKRLRLRKRHEFLAVQRSGRRVTTPHFVVYARSHSGSRSRIGITVSKKVGNACVRNRVKRLLREVFRHHKADLPLGVDFLFVARHELPATEYAVVEREMGQAIARLASMQNGDRKLPDSRTSDARQTASKSGEARTADANSRNSHSHARSDRAAQNRPNLSQP